MFLNQQVDAGVRRTVYINGLSCSLPFSMVWIMPPVCSVFFNDCPLSDIGIVLGLLDNLKLSSSFSGFE